MTRQVLIDLGNTRWKMATASHGLIGPVRQGSYAEPGTFSAALAEISGGAVGALLASVVDRDRTEALLALTRDVTGRTVRRVLADDPVPGIRSGYRNPAQLGVDRLLAMVAARARCSGPLCVVDAGSAVTVDFVDAEGQHLGGFILPGQRLARECLLARTSIPDQAEVERGARLGRDTATAVAMGALQAVAGIIERFVCGRDALFAHGATVFLGGGDAGDLAPLMPVPCEQVEHLVLSGLAVVATAEAS